jgi:4'-phosphopantetheinyl transferase EntD
MRSLSRYHWGVTSEGLEPIHKSNARNNLPTMNGRIGRHQSCQTNRKSPSYIKITSGARIFNPLLSTFILAAALGQAIALSIPESGPANTMRIASSFRRTSTRTGKMKFLPIQTTFSTLRWSRSGGGSAFQNQNRKSTACYVAQGQDWQNSVYLSSLATKHTSTSLPSKIFTEVTQPLHTSSTRDGDTPKHDVTPKDGGFHVQSVSDIFKSSLSRCKEEANKLVVRESESSSKESDTEAEAAVPVASDQYETVFCLDIPEGKCVCVEMKNPYQAPTVSTSLDSAQIESNEKHWIKQILHCEEVQYGREMPSDPNRLSFFMGRIAMRSALAIVGSNNDNDIDVDYREYDDDDDVGKRSIKLPSVAKMDQSILKDEHGRPQVPIGYLGSISHKNNYGVALVTEINTGGNIQEDGTVAAPPKVGIGVDIERPFNRGRSIARKILTPNEIADLGGLSEVTSDEEVLLRFSLKESVYKAMHPLICQFVGFQEAEIKPHDDGTATVTLNLKNGMHKTFKKVEAHWRRIDGDLFLSSSRVELKD